jgi:IclR family transcriptional regulator, pca regulon regulatory protein
MIDFEPIISFALVGASSSDKRRARPYNVSLEMDGKVGWTERGAAPSTDPHRRAQRWKQVFILKIISDGDILRWLMETSGLSSRNSYVRSFARGLSVIRSFTADSPAQTVGQVARTTGLDRAGARRMLRTLEALGYVQHEGPRFHLTPRVLDLAYIYLSTTALWGAVEPVVEKLVRAVQESSSVSILDRTEIVYLVALRGPRLMTAHATVGSRYPAYCTASGRVLLGSLSEDDLDRTLKASRITRRTRYSITSISELKRIIRREHDRGWSFLNQEVEEGLFSLAVPIVDRSRRIIAAINVIGTRSRSTPRTMISRFLPRLKHAASEINTLLSGKAPSLADRSSVLGPVKRERVRQISAVHP